MVANVRLRSMHGMLRLDRLFIRYDQFIGRREITRCNVMVFHDDEGYLIPRFITFDSTNLAHRRRPSGSQAANGIPI